MEKKHLELEYNNDNRQYVNGKILAVVRNTITKEGYIISNYGSIERAKELAPKAFKIMVKHPSKLFKTFINKIS